VGVRRVPARGLRQAGQHRRLGEGDVGDVLAEVLARRRRDPVGAAAQVDVVQVEQQNVVLRQLLLEPQRQDDLLHLALVALLRAQQHRLDDLLRDGAAALHFAAGDDVVEERAHDAGRVDALVAVEGVVLGGDECLAHVLWDAIERHQVALLRVELADHGSIVGQDLRRHRRLILHRGVDRRQVAGDLPVHEGRGGAGQDDRDDHGSDEQAPHDQKRAAPRSPRGHAGRTIAAWTWESS
jgi:hypothetical protein